MLRFPQRVSTFKKLRRRERGQTLILFAMLIVPISFAIGVVAVDSAAWTSERRGAQKDADLAALAGAFELIDKQVRADAEDAAIGYANTNDEAGNADEVKTSDDPAAANVVVVNDDCFPGNDVLPLNAVTVNLDHDTRGFFLDFFNIPFPQPGAHARACVGSLTNPQGLRPFAIDKAESDCFVQDEDTPPPDPDDIGLPKFGADCVMDFGAQGSPGGSNRGIIDLQTDPDDVCSDNGGGSSDVLENIEEGAEGECFTNSTTSCPELGHPNTYAQCIQGETGNVAGKVPEGIRTLIELADVHDAVCNPGGDVAEFEEVVELFPSGGSAPPDPDNLYTPLQCADGEISERIIVIVAVDEWLHPQPMPIRYFVPMYIVGCENPDTGTMYKDCDKNAEGAQGHIRLHGIIFQAFLVEMGNVGVPTEGSPIKAITLDE